jgi:hypothetical protein
LKGKKLDGYLDHLRRNIENLDVAIGEIQKAPKGEKAAEKRARLKLLRDLTELQNSTLMTVKTHLLGRDETGSPKEPPDIYEGTDQVEFERYFKGMLSPWTDEHLKLQCEDCGKNSEEVSTHHFPEEYAEDSYTQLKAAENVDLCKSCYGKRLTAAAENESTGVSPGKPE